MYTYDRAFKIVKRNRIYNIQKILFMRQMRIESVSLFLGGVWRLATKLN